MLGQDWLMGCMHRLLLDVHVVRRLHEGEIEAESTRTVF